MSAEHRKPIAAFVVLVFVAAAVVGIQRAEAQGGRLLAAVIGTTVRVQGTLALSETVPALSVRRVAALGPASTQVTTLLGASAGSEDSEVSSRPVAAGIGQSDSGKAVATSEKAAAKAEARDAKRAAKAEEEAAKRRTKAADKARKATEKAAEKAERANSLATRKSSRAAEKAVARAERRSARAETTERADERDARGRAARALRTRMSGLRVLGRVVPASPSR